MPVSLYFRRLREHVGHDLGHFARLDLPRLGLLDTPSAAGSPGTLR